MDATGFVADIVGLAQRPQCPCLPLKAVGAGVLSSFSARACSVINAESHAHGFELELHSTVFRMLY